MGINTLDKINDLINKDIKGIDFTNENEPQALVFVRISACIFLNICSAGVLVNLALGDAWFTIATIFHLMTSIYMLLRFYKTGCGISIILSIVLIFLFGFRLFVKGDMSGIPRIVIQLMEIFIVLAIFFYGRSINCFLKGLSEQKDDLVKLSEEIQSHNNQLVEYADVLSKKDEELSFYAFFDVLTGLPNRKMLLDKITLCIERAKKGNKRFRLIFSDIDDLKIVNDTLGHQAGDEIIRTVANRLKENVNSEDVFGRLNGDEFVVIIERDISDDEVFEYIESFRLAIMQPNFLDNNKIKITSSFGIAQFPDDGDSSKNLMRCADMAINAAKMDGKNVTKFFKREMQEEMIKKLELKKCLLEAIENNELYLVYQPQYTTDCKKLRGFEVLTRWRSNKLGFVGPSEFIPLAENIGLITEMGRWILNEACKRLKEAYERFNTNIILSINISAIQLMEPDFVESVQKILRETGIRGKNLEFEITESVLITSTEQAIQVISKLKQMGILIALDDFGTGYSSLNYLCKLPIDTLKIDKSFVDGIIETDINKKILGTIIRLAHKMNIEVVAEGVEEDIQHKYLRDKKCDIIQGFLWGKPLGIEDFFSVIKENSAI